MMGCSTSRIDRLPAVSHCHDRCKFLGEALYHSYAFADAHVAYLQSLKAVGSSLRRFSDQNSDNDNTMKSDTIIQPEFDQSSSNSDSHLDFPTDSEDETEIDEFGEKDFDLLQSIQNPGFRDDYFGNSGGLFQAAPLDSGGSAWKTPSPPPPSGSSWGFLNFFDAYERYDLPPPKEEIHELKNQFQNEEKKQSKPKLKTEHKTEKTKETEQKTEKKDSTEVDNRFNRSSLETAREIEAQFERAAESGNEVLKILDTGKFRYFEKNSIYQSVSWKMLRVVSGSFPVIQSKKGELLEKINGGGAGDGDDEEVGVIAVNLSSTLKKLCMWEKKLYDEVKAEEKLQIVLARSYRQIKNMGEKGANGDKVDYVGSLIRALTTKIRVAIQVIDNTSITINMLRDEELWPFIAQLIHKQLGMWKAMLECHKCQSKALVEAKNLDAILSNGIFNESRLESAIHLKLELQNWNLNFSSWITAQKCYVKALNGWLLKCGFSYQPEEEEEIPGGTPVIFAFCNRWSHTAGGVSEMEVVNAMNELFLIVNNLVERQYMYLQQRLSAAADKNLVKRMKILERKEKMLQRVIQARGKKMFPAAFPAGGGVHRSQVTQNTSFEFGLKQIFKDLERFCVNNVQIYEELCVASGCLS